MSSVAQRCWSGWTASASPSRPQGGTDGNVEVMGGRDFQDLGETPEAVASATATLAADAAHLARVLEADPRS